MKLASERVVHAALLLALLGLSSAAAAQDCDEEEHYRWAINNSSICASGA